MRLRALLAALLYSLGCHRHTAPVPVPATQPESAAEAPAQRLVFTQRDPTATLVEHLPATAPEPPPEATTDSAPAAAPADGPPVAGLAAVRRSLSPTAPDALDPAGLPFYEIDLQLDPAAGQIKGSERVDYPNHSERPLEKLPLRIFANDRSPQIAIDAATSGDVALKVDSPEPSLVWITLPHPVPVGAWAHFTISFSGTASQPEPMTEDTLLQALLSEPGQSPDYGLFSVFAGGMAAAEFLPMVAGRWQNAFDVDTRKGVGDSSYFDPSNFLAHVSLPSDMVLAAPGVVISDEIAGGRRKRITVALADARDLALFASSHYRESETIEAGIRVRSIYQEGASEPGQAVLDTSSRALSYFGRAYHAYPYSTFTAVEVPLRGGAGGAEFPGIVAVAGLAYGEGDQLPGGARFAPAFLAELREFIVAHEVAHQWWALAVASHPRLEPDVDEPLAQFSAAAYVGHVHGLPARQAVLNSQVGVNYQVIRMLNIADAAAARPTATFQNSAEYAGLVYGKAPFFYESLAQKYGDSTMERSLAGYAAHHWMGLAHRGDIVADIAAGSFAPVGEVQAQFDRWFRGAHGDEDMKGRGDVNDIALKAFTLGDSSTEGLLKELPQGISPQDLKELGVEPK